MELPRNNRRQFIKNVSAGIGSLYLPVLSGSAGDQAEQKKKIVVQEPLPNVSVKSDHEHLLQLIGNLLSNAIKFTPLNGKVEIEIVEKLSVVELFIKDNGVGMEEQIVKQLFENKYYTTQGTANETGTGLGLMLCNDFITRNGGTIQVKSEVGVGSVFSFALPRKMVA